MEIALFWFMLCLLVGYAAGQRGHSGLAYFFVSLILSPLIGFLVLLASGTSVKPTPQPQDIAREPCPECGEMIAVTAKKCRFCGAQI